MHYLACQNLPSYSSRSKPSRQPLQGGLVYSLSYAQQTREVSGEWPDFVASMLHGVANRLQPSRFIDVAVCSCCHGALPGPRHGLPFSSDAIAPVTLSSPEKLSGTPTPSAGVDAFLPHRGKNKKPENTCHPLQAMAHCIHSGDM